MFVFSPLQASAKAADLITVRELLSEAPTSDTVRPSPPACLGLTPTRVFPPVSVLAEKAAHTSFKRN